MLTFWDPGEPRSRDGECAVEDVIQLYALVAGCDALRVFVGQSCKETYHPGERQERSEREEKPPDRQVFLQGCVPLSTSLISRVRATLLRAQTHRPSNIEPAVGQPTGSQQTTVLRAIQRPYSSLLRFPFFVFFVRTRGESSRSALSGSASSMWLSSS